MNPRLMIQRAGEPPMEVELASPIHVGGGDEDELSVPGAPEGAAELVPSLDGVVVSARVELIAGGRVLSPGQRRLLRADEVVVVGSCAVGPTAAAPEGTRELAGAILAGTAGGSGPRLVVLDGPSAGARLLVTDGAVLGRARSAELRLDDPLASRRHLRLRQACGAFDAEDLGSKNGTAVNGRRLRRRPTRLAHGDELTVGATALLFDSGGGHSPTRDGSDPPPCPERDHEAGDPGADASPIRVAGAVLASGALAAAALALAGLAG